MLSNVKNWIIGVLSVVATILLGWLKIRESELEVAEEKNKSYEQEKKALKAKDKADKKVLTELDEEKREIETDYDSKVKQANKDSSSRPLSLLSIKLLQRRNSGERTSPPSSGADE